jgi:polysaccharide deacetylase family protein (PEP-CTERM system associated)
MVDAQARHALASPPRPPRNMLTIDVEEWYHLNYRSMAAHATEHHESRVRANTEHLLTILSATRAEATFFFLGSVAEREPGLVRDVRALGHEIASHGYGHQLASSQTRAQFADDVKRSLDILQGITNERVVGYRAPSWSISRDTPWAYDVLVDLGFRYDASLFPFRTYLYGDSTAPTRPFTRHLGCRSLHEVPATVLELGRWRVPFGGGFYFRVQPLWLTRLASRLANRRAQPVVFYLHPREIDPLQPRLALPLVDRLVTYINLRSTAPKLAGLLRTFPTVSVARYLDAWEGTA